jgi:hypothetical protein
VISGEIETLEDGMRVVAGMMRAYHDCDGRQGWLAAAERLEAVAADPGACPVLHADAMRAVLTFLGADERAGVAA